MNITAKELDKKLEELLPELAKIIPLVDSWDELGLNRKVMNLFGTYTLSGDVTCFPNILLKQIKIPYEMAIAACENDSKFGLLIGSKVAAALEQLKDVGATRACFSIAGVEKGTLFLQIPGRAEFELRFATNW